MKESHEKRLAIGFGLPRRGVDKIVVLCVRNGGSCRPAIELRNQLARSVLGRIEKEGTACWTHLIDENGNLLLAKVEGLCFDPMCQERGWVLTESDNHLSPTELCEIRLDDAS